MAVKEMVVDAMLVVSVQRKTQEERVPTHDADCP